MVEWWDLWICWETMGETEKGKSTWQKGAKSQKK
jgi:hypothetical protein